MTAIETSASLRIPASPERVYAVLADYEKGHPAILPRPPFKSIELVEGGVGAGTVIDVSMVVMGMERRFHMVIAEPEPGRILTETDEAAGVVTSFIVDPIAGEEACTLTMKTRARAASGFMGWMERMFAPAVTRRIFARELRLVSDYVSANKDL